MTLRGDGLRAAHRGYIYQDIAAAYVLVQAVVEGVDRVVIDRKVVEDDRIDDLEIVVATRRVRRQIKWSGNPNRSLTKGDFTGANSSLRIDALVMTLVRAGASRADEYRLCATWAIPASDDDVTRFLREVAAEPTIPGTKTLTFRFDADGLWPANGVPKWDVLTTDRFQREHFVRFCSAFIIELDMPQASRDLMKPGVLETALLDVLTRRLGVGKYPNAGRIAEDVAALAVFIATTSRSGGEELTPADVATKLRLRSDYGHVAQAFPIDATVVVNRTEARADLLRTALDGGLQLVTAPPGAGKSWELTQLADDLRACGAIVARHYCYLDPSDSQSALRITSDVFFGNLIYELTQEAPELREEAGLGFAADFDGLERLLRRDPVCGRPMVLIVDGVDHIARVLAQAPGVSSEQSDIIKRLAALEIPTGVAVVIGSQPGHHLDPLYDQWASRLVSRVPARVEHFGACRISTRTRCG